MKNSKEFMNEFMTTLYNMKKYQGIDITRLETYSGDFDIVHDSFNLEKKIVDTAEAREIKEISNAIEGTPKQLRLARKK